MRRSWVWPWTRVSCPFCFHSFHPSEAPLRPLPSNEQKWFKLSENTPDPYRTKLNPIQGQSLSRREFLASMSRYLTEDEFASQHEQILELARTPEYYEDEHIARYLKLDNPATLNNPVLHRPGACSNWRWVRVDGSWEKEDVPDPVKTPWWRRICLTNDWTNQFDKICPDCHLPLPLGVATGELNSEVIALIGDTASGKSTYFGVLINQLYKSRLPHDIGMTVMAQDTFDVNTFSRVSSHHLYKKIYGDHLHGEVPQAPEATRPVIEGVRPPLIYRLQFGHRPQRSWRNPLGRVKALDLVFFDTAGEDINSDETLERHYPFLSQARGLIFMVDPLTLPGIQQALPVDEGVDGEFDKRNDDPLDSILDALLRLFTRYGTAGTSQDFNLPVAFTISKTDVLRPLLPDDSPLFRHTTHTDGFDRANAQQVDRAIREFLIDRGQSHLVNVANRFTRSTFCGVSALGTQPERDRRITKSTGAYRVADPLLWVLHQLGYLQARN